MLAALALASGGLARAEGRGREEPGLVIHMDFLLSLRPELPVHGSDGDFALVDGEPMRGPLVPLVGGGVGWHQAGFTELGTRLLLGGAAPAALSDDKHAAELAVDGGTDTSRLELLSTFNPRLEPYAMVDVEFWHLRVGADVFVATTLYLPYGVESGRDAVGRTHIVVAPGSSLHLSILKSALGQGVDLGLRSSLSLPVVATSADRLDDVQHYAWRAGVGPELASLGWVAHVGIVLRFDGVQ
jgi:hypothetical protein